VAIPLRRKCVAVSIKYTLNERTEDIPKKYIFISIIIVVYSSSASTVKNTWHRLCSPTEPLV
jgi:hypothetical protein